MEWFFAPFPVRRTERRDEKVTNMRKVVVLKTAIAVLFVVALVISQSAQGQGIKDRKSFGLIRSVTNSYGQTPCGYTR